MGKKVELKNENIRNTLVNPRTKDKPIQVSLCVTSVIQLPGGNRRASNCHLGSILKFVFVVRSFGESFVMNYGVVVSIFAIKLQNTCWI